MAYHQPSFRFLTDTLAFSGTIGTIFTAAPVFSVAFPVCCSPVKMFPFRTYIGVKIKVISEPVFSKDLVLVGMPSVTDYTLNFILLQ